MLRCAVLCCAVLSSSPDKRELGHPGHNTWHLLPAEQEAAKQNGQQHCQAAQQVGHSCGGRCCSNGHVHGRPNLQSDATGQVIGQDYRRIVTSRTEKTAQDKHLSLACTTCGLNCSDQGCPEEHNFEANLGGAAVVVGMLSAVSA